MLYLPSQPSVHTVMKKAQNLRRIAEETDVILDVQASQNAIIGDQIDKTVQQSEGIWESAEFTSIYIKMTTLPPPPSRLILRH